MAYYEQLQQATKDILTNLEDNSNTFSGIDILNEIFYIPSVDFDINTPLYNDLKDIIVRIYSEPQIQLQLIQLLADTGIPIDIFADINNIEEIYNAIADSYIPKPERNPLPSYTNLSIPQKEFVNHMFNIIYSSLSTSPINPGRIISIPIQMDQNYKGYYGELEGQYYEQDDCVIHDNKEYRCNVINVDKESTWDPSKWDLILKLPSYSNNNTLDIYADENKSFQPGQKSYVETNIIVEIPIDYGLLITPDTNLCINTKLRIVNSPIFIQSKIDEINSDKYITKEKIKILIENIEPPIIDIPLCEEYNPTETYQINDYVIYSNETFRCLENNITGQWNPTKWIKDSPKTFGTTYTINKGDIIGHLYLVPIPHIDFKPFAENNPT